MGAGLEDFLGFRVWIQRRLEDVGVINGSTSRKR